jgi:hypothetical protein
MASTESRRDHRLLRDSEIPRTNSPGRLNPMTHQYFGKGDNAIL